MADIKIYNANQIGGNYTVIATEKAKIMIDYGQWLPGSKAEQEEFDWKNDSVDAVFFTHYHGDHVGRILEIPEHIPLYMGSTARQIMLNIHRAMAKVEELREEQVKYIQLLEDTKRVHELKEGCACEKIQDIEIIPYSVDHSAYDAYMFLIKTPNENILHTGDFREHGYRGSKMLRLIEKLVLPKAKGRIDTLIIEGTMMERKGEKVRTEYELQQEATKLFQERKHIFLVCSSTNLDTLASFHKAARKNDMYTYCYSNYLLGQLETFTKTAGEKSDLYQFDKTYLVELEKELHHKYWSQSKTQEQFMRENGFLCIIKPEERYAKWVERFADVNPLIIYALWDGYLDENKDAYNAKWDAFFAPYKASGQFLELHTSGHATSKTIARIIEAVKPQKRIYPMHTGRAEEFFKLPIREEYKRRIIGMDQKGIDFQGDYRLDDNERRKMLELEDNRAVSKTLLNAFVEPKGAFYEFKKYVEGKKEFAVCLRGNGHPETITIYHNNHVVWELYISRNKYRVRINFDHARYTINWMEQLEKIKRIFEIDKDIAVKKDGANAASIGHIMCEQPPNARYYSASFVKDSAEILIGIIDDFCNPELNWDYFKESVGIEKCIKTTKDAYVEKRWQQTLFHHFKEEDGIYVYDLEFSQKFPSSPDPANPRKNTIKEKLKEVINEPDMLGIRFENGKPKSLVLIEVKSTYGACVGEKSGVDKHLEGMYKYSQEKFFIRNRINEARDMLEELAKINGTPKMWISDINNSLKVERLLILTNGEVSINGKVHKSVKGSAVDYYDQRVLEKCKQSKCSLYLIKDRYDEAFQIEKVYIHIDEV